MQKKDNFITNPILHFKFYILDFTFIESAFRL